MPRILAIETSCDETSVALLHVTTKKVELVHHETATQIPIHARYGGVVPEIAARTHVAETVSLLERAHVFDDAKFDVIAVTRGPGLATALRVGLEAGRTLAFATGKPIVGVNHLEGHLASAWLVPENRRRWKFPVLALLVSGGHTELVLMKDYCSYKVVGRTRDDAAGEAFDKTAKLMGLGYPGGPMIAKLALKANVQRPTPDTQKDFSLPRPMIREASFDFSFSGLKTAVQRLWASLSQKEQADQNVVGAMCAEIQQAIVDVLVLKTVAAAKKYYPKTLCIVGGVSANEALQEGVAKAVRKQLPGVTMLAPAKGFHTDNAAMIAAAAAWQFEQRPKGDDWKTLDAEPELDL